jgi:hypothetical protein
MDDGLREQVKFGRNLCWESESQIFWFQKKNSFEASYRRLRGKCYSEMANFDDALNDFREVISIAPDSKTDGKNVKKWSEFLITFYHLRHLFQKTSDNFETHHPDQSCSLSHFSDMNFGL